MNNKKEVIVRHSFTVFRIITGIFVASSASASIYIFTSPRTALYYYGGTLAVFLYSSFESYFDKLGEVALPLFIGGISAFVFQFIQMFFVMNLRRN